MDGRLGLIKGIEGENTVLKFKNVLLLTTVLICASVVVQAQQVSGIRITQTGNTGLMVDVDVTAFYTTGATETEAYLGTYYNSIPAINWGDGSTVPRYGYGPSTGIPLVSTSTVVNGIPARAYRGSFSHTYGSSGNYTISANTRCCPIATPTYTLVTGTPVTTTVTTTGVFGPTTFTTSFVQNTLAVGAVEPTFAKAFAPDTVAVGVPSTMTFTIDNTASTLDANALDFTDNLPAGMAVAAAPNVVNTCTGGTVTAVAGTAVVSYTGGLVSAGATCTLSVDVVGSSPGALVNTTGDLTSGIGNSGTASDTLTVTAVAPTFSKSFAPTTIGAGGVSTLTLTIDNSANAADATALDVTDNFPAGMLVAPTPNVANTCTGGTVTAVAGSVVLTYTGGTVAANASCTVSVDVTAAAVGVLANTTGDLTSAFGNSGSASDSLTVANSPGFSKVFAPDSVGVGVVSTLTFTIDNSANVAAATGLDFTDNFPAGLVVATPSNASTSCTGGTLTAVAGATSVAYTGGSVAGGATCTISVDTVAASGGSLANTSGDLTSSLGNSGAANDTLNVAAMLPGFSKVFAPDTVGIAAVSTLTFTIDNTANAAAAGNLDFTDNFPANMVVATPANATNNCTGGTLTATAGSAVVNLAGASVAANSSCTVSVDVVGNASGSLVNNSGDLTSAFGNSGSATDTLTVASAPLFSKSFAPDVLSLLPSDVIGDFSTTLTFTIDNSANNLAATGLAFVDNMPAGMVVANAPNTTNSCTGGTLVATAGSGQIDYSGGTVGANAVCTISVDVSVTSIGNFDNVAGPLTSSLGTSGPATATDSLLVGILNAVPSLSVIGQLLLLLVFAYLAMRYFRRRNVTN